MRNRFGGARSTTAQRKQAMKGFPKEFQFNFIVLLSVNYNIIFKRTENIEKLEFLLKNRIN